VPVLALVVGLAISATGCGDRPSSAGPAAIDGATTDGGTTDDASGSAGERADGDGTADITADGASADDGGASDGGASDGGGTTLSLEDVEDLEAMLDELDQHLADLELEVEQD
jgi:hypothetical protein